jgi:glycosyltransferase involved in cell wall biosynthesis
MNIGVDASCWANQRGYGRYTRELLREAMAMDRANRYCLFLDRATADQCDDMPDVRRIVVETSAAATQAAAASGRRSLRDLWAMRRGVAEHRDGLDLFYFPSVYTYFPMPGGPKVAVTIHDTIAEHFPRLIFPNRRSELFWRIKVRWAIAQADRILAVSRTAKRDIVGEYGVDEARIGVVTDAVSPVFRPMPPVLPPRYGLAPGERFVLYVGGISPHKNLATLLDAMPPGEKLVLVGDYRKDVFYSSYPALRRKLGDSDRVVFTGHVPDDDLVSFYNAATCLVIPSFDEGFGLPAVEAMACGLPVIASEAGALPEVVGDAGLRFDPNSTRQLSEAIARLLGDEPLRRELSRRGLERAGHYTWRRSAEQLLGVFAELAATP